MSEVELPNPEELKEEAGKRFSKRVALTTALYAVLLAITSLGGNNATKDMMLSQQMSNNQWSYYQSKSIKESFSRDRRESVEAILSGSSTVYLFSIVMATLGAALSLNGFLLLFTLPFLGP